MEFFLWKYFVIFTVISLKTMKKHILLILFLSTIPTVFGQQLDSIKYDYGHLYYRTYGKGETIIMLSGGPGNNVLQLESVALKLSKKNKIILLEQRGTGLSIPTPFDSTTVNMKSAVDDINLLLKHLKLNKTIIFGHSYGASLALIYAVQYPEKVKSLVLLAPGYFGMGWPMANLAYDNSMSKLGKDEKERLIELSAKQQSQSDAEQQEYNKLLRLPYVFNKSKIDSLMPLMNGKRNVKTFQLLVNSSMDYMIDEKSLTKIKCPIDLICGRQDFLTYVAYELKIEKPSIELHWIDKSGHFPMHENPIDFYTVMNQILEENKETKKK